MCGIVGVVGTSAVNQRIYDGLTVLQHRGQDAAGIATSGDGELCVRKGSGLVRDVFQQDHMLELKGNVGIGHVRYPTAGCDGIAEAQPFYVNAPYGICLAHNGNLTNASELAEIIIREDRRHLNTTSDSEVLLNVFASELQRIGTPRITPADVFAALNAVYRRCRGGYAVVAMIVGHGILGFRDPNGIRPLVLGRRDTPRGPEWMLASESVALDSLSFQLVRDIAPGRGCVHRRAGPPALAPVCRDRAAYALHFRICVLRPPRFKDRQHLGVSRSHAYGRPARREDSARAPESRHRRRHSDSRHESHQRPAVGAAPRGEVPRGLYQEPLHRPYLHHAGPGAA